MDSGFIEIDWLQCLDIKHRAPIELVALLKKSTFLSLRMQLENRYVS